MKQTFVFQQGVDGGALPPDVAGGGVCATLSARWIKLMRDEKAQGAGHRRADLVAAVQKYSILVQNRFGRWWQDMDDLRGQFAWLIRTGGDSRIVNEWSGNGYPPTAHLVDAIKDERRMGFHLTLWFDDDSGHSFAFWRSGKSGTLFGSGHIYFFDSNHGEYKADRSKVTNWLRGHVTANYPAVTGYVLFEVDRPAAVKFGVKV